MVACILLGCVNQLGCLGWGLKRYNTRCVFVMLSVGVVEGVFWASVFSTWRFQV